MFIITKQNKIQINLLIIKFIICLLIPSSNTISYEFITNDKELEKVAGTVNNCTYVNEHSSLCKTGVYDPGNIGYWSSCEKSYCDISISVGNWSQIPNSVEILVNVKGDDANIKVRYKLTPSSDGCDHPGGNMTNTNNWQWSPSYSLNQLGLNPNSEIIIRLESSILTDSLDILERIRFTFPDQPTTEATISTSRFESTILNSESTAQSTLSTIESTGQTGENTSPNSETPQSTMNTASTTTANVISSSVSNPGSTDDSTPENAESTSGSTAMTSEITWATPESTVSSSKSTLSITDSTPENIVSTSASTLSTTSSISDSTASSPEYTASTSVNTVSTSASTPRITDSTLENTASTLALISSTTGLTTDNTASTPEDSVSTPDNTMSTSENTMSTLASTPSIPDNTVSTLENTVSTLASTTSITGSTSESTVPTSVSTPSTTVLTSETIASTSSTNVLTSETTTSTTIPSGSTSDNTESTVSTSVLSSDNTESTVSTTVLTSETTASTTITSGSTSDNTESTVSTTVLSSDNTESTVSTTVLTSETTASTTITSGSTSDNTESTVSTTVLTPEMTASTTITSGSTSDNTESTVSTTVLTPETTASTTITSGSTLDNAESTVSTTVLTSETTASTSTTTILTPETTASTSSTSSLTTKNTVSTPSSTESTDSASENTVTTSEVSDSTPISTGSTPENTIQSTTYTTMTPENTFSTTKNIESTFEPLPETTTTGCISDVFCIATDRYNTYWKVCAGILGYQNCPKNTLGFATWYCQQNGIFIGDMPNYKNCSHEWIPDIENEVGEGLPILPARAFELINLITQRCRENSYFGHEIESIVNLCGRILSQVVSYIEFSQFDTLTDNTWEIFGIILSSKEPWTELSIEDRSKTGTGYLFGLDKTGLELSNRAVQNTFERESVYRKNFDKFNQFKILSGVQIKGNSLLAFPEEYSTEDSHIDLPTNWATYFEEEKIQFVGMQIKPEESNYIFPGHLNNINSDKTSSQGKFLNGNIMGFSFGGGLTEKLLRAEQKINFTGDGVKITFRHDLPAWGKNVANIRRRLHVDEKPKAVIGTSACVYWNPENLIWSSEGCFLVNSERDETVCECTHLTSFALLMDVHNYVGKDFVLELLTLILCPISMFCFAICIFIFLTVKSERSPRNIMTINLCCCLLLGNLFMIFLMDKHYFNLSDGLCVASAILIHYVFLCAVMWMALEGYIIFKTLFLDVFNQGRDYIRVQYGIAYGVPFIIVGITGLIDRFSQDVIYGGNDSFCWLNENYIWAFMGPTAIILMLNLLILIFSLRKAYIMYTNPKTVLQNKEKSYLSWIKGCVSLSILLGLTWIFGFFMTIDNSIFANISAYIFTILNASQGILLFIFHCVMNPNVQSVLKRRYPLLSSCLVCTDSDKRRPTIATQKTTLSASEPPSDGSSNA